MKKEKTLVKLLSCALLAGVLLAGCTNGNAPASSETASGTSQQSTASISADTPSWKLDTSPLTIRWFVAYDWYSKVFSPDKNEADKKMLEETGITLEIETGDTEKLNVLISTNSLPDVVTFDAVASQRLQLENNGRVEPLEPLIKQYAPDINVPQSMLDWYRNKDGNSYCIASYFFAPEHCNDEYGGYYDIHNINLARADILKQIGMTKEDMQTKEGFLNACRAVKNQNIQYDGKPVIPYMADVYMALTDISQQFGISPEDKNGNLTDTYAQPEYKEAMRFLNTMYNEGLMTDESFTFSNEQRDEKVASGLVFSGTDHTVIGQEARRSLFAADPNALFETCGLMDSISDKPHYVPGINTAGWTGTLINKTAEHKDRIIRLFSYLTSEEITLDTEYGTGCYDIVDGHVVIKTDKQQEFTDTPDIAYAKYKSDFGYFQDWTIIQKYMPTSFSNALEEDMATFSKNNLPSVYDGRYYTGLPLDPESEAAKTSVKIGQYTEEMIPTVIMAPQDQFEAKYEEMIKQCKALGQDSVNEVYNQLFQDRKQLLNMKYAYPEDALADPS